MSKNGAGYDPDIEDVPNSFPEDEEDIIITEEDLDEEGGFIGDDDIDESFQ